MTQQGYLPYEVQASIKTLDELLRQTNAMLDTIPIENTPGNMKNTYMSATPIPTAETAPIPIVKPTSTSEIEDAGDFWDDLSKLIENDKELSALIHASQPSAPQTPSYAHQPQKPASFIPSTIEDIFSNQQPATTAYTPPAVPYQHRSLEEIDRAAVRNQSPQPALQPVSVRQPPVSEIKSYTQPPAPPQLARHPAVTQAMSPLWEQLDRFAENRASRPKPAEPAITEKQMQALGKKHLWMMILDLQEKLERAEEENETILQALQVGYAQGQRIG